MFLHVKQLKYLSEYTIWISFNNGTEGEVEKMKSIA
jgi:hypothetical protein